MTKPVKIVLALAGLLVLTVAAVLVILTLTVDPNKYKKEISQAVERMTGRSFTFEGDLSLSVFPWLGVSTGGLTLGESPLFGDGHFVSVKSADIHLKLLPLLGGRYELDSLEIDNLTLTLVRDTKGRWNWETLRRDERLDAHEVEKVVEDVTGEQISRESKYDLEIDIPALSVRSVHISQAKVLVIDHLTDNRFEFSDINLTTGQLNLGAPDATTELNLSFALETARPELIADVKLMTKASMHTEGQRFSLAGLNLTATARGDDLPGGKAELSLDGTVALNHKKQTISLHEMKLKAYSLSLAGEATVRDIRKNPNYQGELTLLPSDPRQVLAALGIKPPATVDPKALTSLSGHVSLQGGTKALSASDLTLVLDDTRLNGTLAAMDFSKPTLSFRLNADTLDVDRYLPPKEKKAARAGKKTPKEKKSKTGEGLPPETRRFLRSLEMDGTVQVKRLKAAKLIMENTTITVKARNGLIRAHPLETLLYKGKYTGSLTADLRGKTTKTSLNMRLGGLELQNALHALLGKDIISGVTGLSLDVAGTGEDWKTLAKTLTGKGAFSILNGAIEGFQIIPKGVKGHLKNDDQKRKLEKVERRQEFKAIKASFRIGGGELSNQDLTFSAGPLQATAKVGLGLLKGDLDGSALVNITALPTIPIRIGGTVADPKYGLNEVAFLKGMVKGIINAPLKIGEETLGIGADVLEGIGSGLMHLFGPPKKKQKKQQ